jgi:drug/metabolite transporter (DMT)-like permease
VPPAASLATPPLLADPRAASRPPTGDDPLRAILLVIAAMALFSISDALAKYLGAALPALQIAWMRWVGFALIMLPVVVVKGPRLLRSNAPAFQVLRTFGLLGSACFFIAGLHFLPLASAAAIAFAAPLFVTALSVPLLRERVGPRRWAAVLVGLAGVLIVVRPGSGSYGAVALLPLLSAVAWALGMIMTRKIALADGPGTTMAWSAGIGLVVLSAFVPFEWRTPTGDEIGLAAAMAVASTSAQFLIVKAYRLAAVSVLAPISYVQLVWSGLLGFFVFGNAPDGWTVLGSAVIIASGLYTAHRERVRIRQAATITA